MSWSNRLMGAWRLPKGEKGTYNMGEECGESFIPGWTGHLRPLSPRPRRRPLAPFRGTQPHPAIHCSARPELRV